MKIKRKNLIIIVSIVVVLIGAGTFITVSSLDKNISGKGFVNKNNGEVYEFFKDGKVMNKGYGDVYNGRFTQKGKEVYVETEHSEYESIKDEEVLFHDGKYLARYPADKVVLKKVGSNLEGVVISYEEDDANVTHKFYADGTGLRDRNMNGNQNSSIPFQYTVKGSIIEIQTEEPKLGVNGKYNVYFNGTDFFEEVFTEIKDKSLV